MQEWVQSSSPYSLNSWAKNKMTELQMEQLTYSFSIKEIKQLYWLYLPLWKFITFWSIKYTSWLDCEIMTFTTCQNGFWIFCLDLYETAARSLPVLLD
jgi:hypothetical protein